MPHRYLNLPHCYNARDLGGLPAAGAKETRWGAVVRSDVVNRLTQEGQETLIAYGLRMIAAIATVNEMTVVTLNAGNLSDFDVAVETWLAF